MRQLHTAIMRNNGWVCKDVMGAWGVTNQAIITKQAGFYRLTLDGCIECDNQTFFQLVRSLGRLNISLADWQ